jgi:dipeptidyl aminopeptidase/acylaminoacyl peptidase
MFEQPIGRIPIGGGRATFLAEGPTANYSISLDSAGARLAYRSVASGTVGDVYVKDLATDRVTRVTDVNPQLQDLSLGDTRAVSWRSFDGMEIWGLLVSPPGPRTGRVPLLVYCHGGPIGGFTWGLFPQFAHLTGQVEPYPVQAMASAGFAVLLPMPRGGSGYGEAAYDLIDNAWGEPDYRDIMAGVDFAIAEGIADPDRLGVMGASYGGFMTSWIVTQTDRFKAASTGASVNNLSSLYYLSEAGDFLIEYFKAPWEAPDAYRSHSPLTFAANVKTPLLIQHGEADPRVPLSQAREFYRALKVHGKTVEFDVYPRGGHVLYEPAMQREQMRRNLEWFTRWLKPAGSPS